MDNKKSNKEDSVSWSEYLRKKRKQNIKNDPVDQNNQSVEIILTISGMSCSNCERKIEQSLENLHGVEKVTVSYANSLCTLSINTEEISRENIIKKIEELGYQAENIQQPGDDSSKIKKNESFSIKQIIGIAIIITALFLILNKTGIFNLVPEVNESIGYGLLFVIGLLTSLHCIAMCGGINLSQSINKKSCNTTNVVKQLKPGLLYNIGRLISYTIIGGIVGVIGSFVSFSGNIQGIIIIIAGSFMIIMGINMLDMFPFLRNLTIKPPKVVSKTFEKLGKGKGPFIIGLLNGFMPCGPLQTMQLYALGTGSFLAGAFSMFLFGLGTIPLMFGFGALGALLTKKFTHRMLKISALLVFLLGVGMIARGLSLSGVNLDIVPQEITKIAVVEDTIQKIETYIEPSYYEPIVVQKGIPVQWNIKATEATLNGCNNPITIPEYNIKKKLIPGDNYIEFTPEKSGKVTFTCWMGMITSTILVVDDISDVDKSAVDEIYKEAAGNTGCGGCASNPGGGSCGTAGENGCGTAGSSSCSTNSVGTAEIPDFDLDSIGFAEIRDGVQYAYIDVTGNGYYPEVMVMQRGIVTEWVFRGLTLDDKNYRMEFPAYRARMELKEGDNTISKFLPQNDFHYSSWQGDYNGFISVINDISDADRDAIKENIKNYTPIIPQNGGGGCCGG